MIDNLLWMASQQVPQTKKIQNYVFNLADLLGRGNFSKVYKATNELTGIFPLIQEKLLLSRWFNLAA